MTSSGHSWPPGACLGPPPSPLPRSGLTPSVPQTSRPLPRRPVSGFWGEAEQQRLGSRGHPAPRAPSALPAVRDECPRVRPAGSSGPLTLCVFSFFNTAETAEPTATPAPSAAPLLALGAHQRRTPDTLPASAPSCPATALPSARRALAAAPDVPVVFSC